MWSKIDGNDAIVNKIKTSYSGAKKFAFLLLAVPFVIAFIVTVFNMLGSNISMGPGIFWLCFCIFFVFLFVYLSKKIKFPFDTENVYMTEPVVVDKVYTRMKHNRSEAAITVITSGGVSAKQMTPLHEGDYCRFVHFGDSNLNESYETDCRFAISESWINDSNFLNK